MSMICKSKGITLLSINRTMKLWFHWFAIQEFFLFNQFHHFFVYGVPLPNICLNFWTSSMENFCNLDELVAIFRLLLFALPVDFVCDCGVFVMSLCFFVFFVSGVLDGVFSSFISISCSPPFSAFAPNAWAAARNSVLVRFPAPLPTPPLPAARLLCILVWWCFSHRPQSGQTLNKNATFCLFSRKDFTRKRFSPFAPQWQQIWLSNKSNRLVTCPLFKFNRCS